MQQELGDADILVNNAGVMLTNRARDGRGGIVAAAFGRETKGASLS